MIEQKTYWVIKYDDGIYVSNVSYIDNDAYPSFVEDINMAVSFYSKEQAIIRIEAFGLHKDAYKPVKITRSTKEI